MTAQQTALNYGVEEQSIHPTIGNFDLKPRMARIIEEVVMETANYRDYERFLPARPCGECGRS